MKKGDTLFWLIGLLAFAAVILGGTLWILNLAHADFGGFVGMLEKLVSLALFVCAVIAGFIWVSSTKWNKTVKIVFEVLFIVFAILAILGVFHVGF